MVHGTRVKNRGMQVMVMLAGGFKLNRVQRILGVTTRTVRVSLQSLQHEYDADSIEELMVLLCKRRAIGADDLRGARVPQVMSVRDRTILDLVMNGSSMKNVARDLNVSERTVGRTMARLQKMGNARTVLQLIAASTIAGFLSASELSGDASALLTATLIAVEPVVSDTYTMRLTFTDGTRLLAMPDQRAEDVA